MGLRPAEFRRFLRFRNAASGRRESSPGPDFLNLYVLLLPSRHFERPAADGHVKGEARIGSTDE
jgi:hypothetical protein